VPNSIGGGGGRDGGIGGGISGERTGAGGMIGFAFGPLLSKRITMRSDGQFSATGDAFTADPNASTRIT
jgi:hypothetical protein